MKYEVGDKVLCVKIYADSKRVLNHIGIVTMSRGTETKADYKIKGRIWHWWVENEALVPYNESKILEKLLKNKSVSSE